MSAFWLVAVILVLMGFAYQYGAAKSRKVAAETGARMHSLPTHYGALVALWCGVPALAILLLFTVFEGGLIRAPVSAATLRLLAAPY